MEEIKVVEVTVAVSVWASVGWTATSRDGIATGECISIVVRDGRGLIGGVGWVGIMDRTGLRLRQLDEAAKMLPSSLVSTCRQVAFTC